MAQHGGEFTRRDLRSGKSGHGSPFGRGCHEAFRGLPALLRRPHNKRTGSGWVPEPVLVGRAPFVCPVRVRRRLSEPPPLSRRCSRATCAGRGFDALGLRLARGRGRAGGFGSTGSRRGAGRLGGTRRARSTRSPGGTARQGGFRQIGATFLARRPLGVVHGPARRAFLRQADA